MSLLDVARRRAAFLEEKEYPATIPGQAVDAEGALKQVLSLGMQPVLTTTEQLNEKLFQPISRGYRGLGRIGVGLARGESLPTATQAAATGIAAQRGIYDEVREAAESAAQHAEKQGGAHKALIAPVLRGVGVVGGVAAEGILTQGGLSGPLKGISVARKGLKMIPKVSAGVTHLEQKVGKAFVYRYGQPSEYQAAAEARLLNISQMYDEAKDLSLRLSQGLSAEQRLTMGKVIRGLDTSSDPTITERAHYARQVLDTVGQEAVEAGLLSQKVYEANKGFYMARFYDAFENPERAKATLSEFFGSYQPNRLTLQRFMKRKDLSPETKDMLGEIFDPAYAVAKGTSQVKHDVITSKFFNRIAANPEWASETYQPGFVQLPATTKGKQAVLGSLSKMYVHPAIAEDVMGMVESQPEFLKLYKSMMEKWKFGKVILNPATHARNVMANMILADLGGLSPHRMDIYGRALKEMREGSAFFDDAARAGLFGRSFTQAEFKRTMESLLATGNPLADTERFAQKIAQAARHGAHAMAKAYQTEEQYFKFAKFLHNRLERGMDTKAAIADAQKWLLNYSEVTPTMQKVRDYAIPFVTFTSKALPLIAESAAQTPLRVSKYILGLAAANEEGLRALHLNEHDWRRITRIMPEHMRAGQFLLLPYRDQYDNLQFMDFTYIFPWGDLSDMGTFSPLQNPLVSKGGLRDILMGLFDVKSGRNWKGDPIYDEHDTATEKAVKTFNALYQLVLPSWMPPIPGLTAGGYSAKAMHEAITRKNPYGQPMSVPSALARQVGIKTTPLNEAFSKRRTVQEFEESLHALERQKDLIGLNRGLTREEQRAAMAQLDEKIRRRIAKGLVRR